VELRLCGFDLILADPVVLHMAINPSGPQPVVMPVNIVYIYEYGLANQVFPQSSCFIICVSRKTQDSSTEVQDERFRSVQDERFRSATNSSSKNQEPLDLRQGRSSRPQPD